MKKEEKYYLELEFQQLGKELFAHGYQYNDKLRIELNQIVSWLHHCMAYDELSFNNIKLGIDLVKQTINACFNLEIYLKEYNEGRLK
jgi:hypothetical protein